MSASQKIETIMNERSILRLLQCLSRCGRNAELQLCSAIIHMFTQSRSSALRTALRHYRLLVCASLWAAQVCPALALNTAISYQGRLNVSGSPANGNFDMTFGVYTNSVGGGLIAGLVTKTNLGVTNGLFTVSLDFGNPFNG